MADKKDQKPQGPDASAPKRPFATIDLKATEVKPAPPPATPVSAGKPGDPARPADSTPAAAASAAPPRPADPKPSDPRAATTASSAPAAHVVATSGGSLGRLASHAFAGIVGGALALTGASHVAPSLGYPLFAPAEPAKPQVPEEVAKRLAALEAALAQKAAASAVPADVAKRLAAADATAQRAEELAKALAAVSAAHTKLAADTKALQEAVAKQATGAELAARLAKLEETIATISSAAAADPQKAGRIPELVRIAGKLADLEEALATRLSALRKDISLEIATRTQSVGEASEAAKAGATRLDKEVTAIRSETVRVGQRADDLKVSVERLQTLLKGLQEDAAVLRASLDAVKTDLDIRMKSVAKPADIAAALAPVAAKVASLDTNVAGVVRNEEDRRTNAERIVLSLELANLRRAMDRGKGYRAELAEVRRVAGTRLDLSVLERFQDQGVPSLAELAREFNALIGPMLDIDAEPKDGGLVDRLLSGARSVVRVRRTSAPPDDKTAEGTIARMETALREGRVADVIAEAKGLEPRVAAPAKAWLAKVEARHAVDGALAAIDTALKTALGAKPAPAPTPAPAAADKGAKQ